MTISIVEASGETFGVFDAFSNVQDNDLLLAFISNAGAYVAYDPPEGFELIGGLRHSSDTIDLYCYAKLANNETGTYDFTGPTLGGELFGRMYAIRSDAGIVAPFVVNPTEGSATNVGTPNALNISDGEGVLAAYCFAGTGGGIDTAPPGMTSQTWHSSFYASTNFLSEFGVAANSNYQKSIIWTGSSDVLSIAVRLQEQEAVTTTEVPYNPQTDWSAGTVGTPNTNSAVYQQYSGGTWAAGDQYVYDTKTDPDNITVTIDDSLNLDFDSAPAQDQTIGIYRIASNHIKDVNDLINYEANTMADGVFNIAKGRVNEIQNRVKNNDPANSALVVVLLRAAEIDGTLEDYDDLAALLAASGNTEADFTNYSRLVLTDADIAIPTVDDTNNNQRSDIPDPSWANAGGATNNTLTKLIICYDSDTTSGTDSNIIPLTHYDFTPTTSGNTLTAVVNVNGYYSAS